MIKHNIFFLKKQDNQYIKSNMNVDKKSLFPYIDKIISDLENRDIFILENYTKISFISIKKKEKKGYILKLDCIKVVITNNSLHVIIDSNENIVNQFIQQMNLNKEEDFEFLILEEIYIFLCNYFNSCLEQFLPKIHQINQLKFQILSHINYRLILETEKNLIDLKFRVNEVLELTEDLIKSDEDMFNMHLTRNSKDSTCYSLGDHDQMEVLLENYQKQLKQIFNDLNKYLKELELSKSIITVSLADRRNDLAVKNIKISIFNISISMSMFISSLFGMNLRNNLENSDYAFYIFASISTIIIVIGFIGSIIFLRS